VITFFYCYYFSVLTEPFFVFCLELFCYFFFIHTVIFVITYLTEIKKKAKVECNCLFLHYYTTIILQFIHHYQIFFLEDDQFSNEVSQVRTFVFWNWDGFDSWLDWYWINFNFWGFQFWKWHRFHTWLDWYWINF
jgi:hypothetical protein